MLQRFALLFLLLLSVVPHMPKIDATNIGGVYQSTTNKNMLLSIDSVVAETGKECFEGAYSRITIANGRQMVTHHGWFRGCTLDNNGDVVQIAGSASIGFEQWDTAQYPPRLAQFNADSTIYLTSEHSSYYKLK